MNDLHKSLFCSCFMNEAHRVKVIVHSSAKCGFDPASIASKGLLSLSLYRLHHWRRSYDCVTQRKMFWRKFVTRLFWGTIDFHSRKKHTMEVNGAPELLCFPHSSEYLPLCSAEQRHSYRFGTTWGWVNDDRIFIFGWTIPLSSTGIFVAIANKATLYGSKL